MVLVKDAVMVGSLWPGSAGAFLMGSTLLPIPGTDCDVPHSGRI
jgi:hypothetical protein